MIRRRLFWHFYIWFIAIIVFSLGIVSISSSTAFRNFFYSSTEDNLQNQAMVIRNILQDEIFQQNYDYIDKVSKSIGQQTQTRITVVLADGTVVADSFEIPAQMDDHSDRPEILQAWDKGLGIATRFSNTLNHNMMYTAIPVKRDNEIVAFIRTSMDVGHINSSLNTILWRIAGLGLGIAIIAAIISFVVSRRISEPIEKMKENAEQFATGNFDNNIQVPKTRELEALAISLNKMAKQLKERLQTVTSQRNELEVVLSSMAEGVVAIDAQSRVISMNRTAGQLLDVEIDNVEKRSVEEVIRDSKILQFIKDALESSEPITMEIASGEKREKYLHVYGRNLEQKLGTDPGAIIVFNDITKLRQLENIRRDFVANVSHELKTPITSIKGFVETLLDGAVNNKDDAQRFLSIIARHTDRLNAIIEDLLILCRIQEEDQAQRLTLEQANIKTCIQAAVETCSMKAKKKQVEIVIESPDIICRIDPFLIEQALVNLIDNAVKYSDENKQVEVTAEQNEKEIKISVQDHGYGIPSAHLERIFERFYVTDKARSRKLGGTGLGLSIVKHICQSHGGRVEVQSNIGQGTRFEIIIPKSPTE